MTEMPKLADADRDRLDWLRNMFGSMTLEVDSKFVRYCILGEQLYRLPASFKFYNYRCGVSSVLGSKGIRRYVFSEGDSYWWLLLLEQLNS